MGDWIERDAGDLTPSFPADAFTAAIETAHALGAKVTAHCFGTEVLPMLIDAGIDCIEHGTGLTTDLIDGMVAHGTALVPTAMQLNNFPEYADQAAEKFPAYAATMPRPPRAPPRHDHGGVRGRSTDLRRNRRAGCSRTAGSPARCASWRRTASRPRTHSGAASWRARGWLGWNADSREGYPADFVVYDADPREDLPRYSGRPGWC